MFDIGFWELSLIGVVALVVIGPERLPSVARTAGKWVGRANRFISNVKQDISREMKDEDLKKILADQQKLADDFKNAANNTQASFNEFEGGLLEIDESVNKKKKKKKKKNKKAAAPETASAPAVAIQEHGTEKLTTIKDGENPGITRIDFDNNAAAVNETDASPRQQNDR